jgi:GNAT superfamily N-acetyltransferase
MIVKSNPKDPEAIELLEYLSHELFNRFGSDGKDSFRDWKTGDDQYVFLLLFKDEEAVACGAIRPISSEIAEIKRMYAKYAQEGLGRQILTALEWQAKEIGYARIWLETRQANSEAIAFYVKNGYRKIENYGKYKGRANAICFEKEI